MLELPEEDRKKMLALIDRRHPAYVNNVMNWVFCRQTARGGRQWFIENIHSYMKEGTTEYQQRVDRAYRFNHSKEVILLLTKYIFKEGVIRNLDNAPDVIKKFWEHTDLDGSPIDIFMREVSDESSTTGRAWLVVDSKNSDGQPITIADEKKMGNRIYAYVVKQEDVLDYSIDDIGQLNWIMFRYDYRNDENPIFDDGSVFNRYLLWTREEWIVLQEGVLSQDDVLKDFGNLPVTVVVDNNQVSPIYAQALSNAFTNFRRDLGDIDRRVVAVVDRGLNPLGEIPMFPCDHMESGDVHNPPGLIDDIAYLDRAVANYLSNLDEIIQNQTFSQLAMPAQALAPGDDAYNKMVEMGTKRIFLYDGEGGVAPHFISPDSGNATIILSVINSIISEIYHSVGMAGERTKQDNAVGIDNSSGVAKAYDFDRMNAMLVSKAAMLERAENKLIYFVNRWSGNIDKAPVTPMTGAIYLGGSMEDEATSLIKYPTNYDIRGLPDEFEIAENLMAVNAPDTVRRAQMQALVNKMMPRLATDVKNAIQKELNSWPPEPPAPVAPQTMETSSVGNKVGDSSVTIKTSQAGGTSTPDTSPSATSNVKGKRSPTKSKQGQNNKGV